MESIENPGYLHGRPEQAPGILIEDKILKHCLCLYIKKVTLA